MDSLEEKVLETLYQNLDESKEVVHVLDDGFDDSIAPMDRALYWDSRDSCLQEILERYSLTASKLREEIIRVVKVARETDYCNCSKPISDGCINCLRRRVVNLLCEQGFNVTLCTSKWKHTRKFPAGTHEFIQLVASTPGRKKQVALVIELELRDQFEIAKACDEYRKLVEQLPEYYVGKPDLLNAIVGVLCDAAKTSMKERRMHMAPWRKRSFMQMKWSHSDCSQRSFDESFDCLLASPGQVLHGRCSHLSTAPPSVLVT